MENLAEVIRANLEEKRTAVKETLWWNKDLIEVVRKV